MVDILDELRWRGLLAQTTDEQALREALSAGPVTLYCGFDPTAPSLHHGHLVQLVHGPSDRRDVPGGDGGQPGRDRSGHRGIRSTGGRPRPMCPDSAASWAR